jgi:hypothetical protein
MAIATTTPFSRLAHRWRASTLRYTDMFVDEEARMRGDSPVNALATRVYANNLHEHSGAPIDDCPPILGIAVLFSRQVWF